MNAIKMGLRDVGALILLVAFVALIVMQPYVLGGIL
jgi:hypothetical protein